MSSETIIYQTKLNWTEYNKGVIIILIGLIFSSSNGTSGYPFVMLGLIVLGITYLRINSSEFVVTDKRVLIKVGILKTKSLETMLNKVEGIHVE